MDLFNVISKEEVEEVLERAYIAASRIHHESPAQGAKLQHLLKAGRAKLQAAAIVARLDDPDSGVRSAAVRALGKLDAATLAQHRYSYST